MGLEYSNVDIRGIDNEETIILVHGMAGNQRVFKGTDDLLAENYKVVSYDLRGHGSDRGDGKVYGLEDYIEQLREVQKFYGDDEVWIVGLSVGCKIVLNYADRYPGSVKGVFGLGMYETILGTDLYKGYEYIRDWKDDFEIEDWLADMAAVINPCIWEEDFKQDGRIFYEYGLKLSDGMMDKFVEMFFDDEVKVSDVLVPVVGIYGDRDDFHRETISTVESEIILSNCGHVTTIYREEETARVIDSCIQRIGVVIDDYLQEA